MRVVRWVLAGAAILATGATLGFLAALLRPRHYAEFSGVRQP